MVFVHKHVEGGTYRTQDFSESILYKGSTQQIFPTYLLSVLSYFTWDLLFKNPFILLEIESKYFFVLEGCRHEFLNLGKKS